jgi:hypothetical protein
VKNIRVNTNCGGKQLIRRLHVTKKHLRPLYMAIEFSSTFADSCWLAALRWMKEVFSKQQKVTQRRGFLSLYR